MTSNLTGVRNGHLVLTITAGGYGTEGLHVFVTAQPRKLPLDNGNRPRASARDRKVPEKPSPFQKMHRCGRSNKKLDCHGGTTSLPIPTGGPVDSIWIGDQATNASAPL